MVYRWIHLFLQAHDPSSLHDKPRSGRPPVAEQLTQGRILAALRLHPRKQGFPQNAWTVATLAKYLNTRYGTNVGVPTLRRRMHAIGLRYKLPKYVYEEKEPSRAQKKGPLRAGSDSGPKGQ
jgi:transposase